MKLKDRAKRKQPRREDGLVRRQDINRMLCDIDKQADLGPYEAGWHDALLNAWRELAKIPSVDSEGVCHGKWRQSQIWINGESLCEKTCSVCHARTLVVSNYCPFCGAKMDGKNGNG